MRPSHLQDDRVKRHDHGNAQDEHQGCIVVPVKERVAHRVEFGFRRLSEMLHEFVLGQAMQLSKAQHIIEGAFLVAFSDRQVIYGVVHGSFQGIPIKKSVRLLFEFLTCYDQGGL